MHWAQVVFGGCFGKIESRTGEEKGGTMSHRERSGLTRWIGLAAGAGLLALCLVLVAVQVAADQGAPRTRPPWRPEAAGEAAAHPLVPTELGDWDGFRVNWPCVISDTTSYRMWYNGHNVSSPGFGWQIGGAKSPDGIAWTKFPGNPMLGVGDPGEWDEMYRGQAACMKDGGTYKMWFSGGSTGAWSTGYATSSDGDTWNVHDGNPVLPASGAGSWDEMESSMPAVIKDGGTYKMWYLGCNADHSVCSIGYATSPDGVAWIKYPDPVLEGTDGEWDEDVVWGPEVMKDGSTYMMWYQSGDWIGLATSDNGIDWDKDPANPVLSEGWDGAGLACASVLLEGSTYKMWVVSGAGANEGIGYATSDDGITWMMYGGNPVLTRGDAGLIASVNYDDDNVVVETLPHTTVAITVTDDLGGVKATTSGDTGDGGWYGTWNGVWAPDRPDIIPGDAVYASGGGLTTEVDPVGSIDAEMDVDADIVTGMVHADWFSLQTLEVRCEVWEENGPRIDVRDVDADGGIFRCDFGAIGWDLEAWQAVGVHYVEPDGDKVVGRPLTLQPIITADYYDDWVDGRYEAGHTAWITVTESDHKTVKATAEVVSQVYPDRGNWTGFATQGEDWEPMYVDIERGDWVDVLMDNGYGNEVKVGTIDGGASIATDMVSGTIHADWLVPGLVRVNCEIHEGEEAPWMAVEDVDPDGGSFECDFSGEWDILPGHNVAVNYVRPDGGARVQTHFIEPTPNMRVEKWPEGSGEAAPGGRHVFALRYRNEGNAAAETIVLTDTLPPNTAYVADSSGVMPDVSPERVVWTLGPLEPWRQKMFYLVLSNTAHPSDTLTNQAEIYTLYDHNEDNNYAETNVHVADDGQPDLWVDKNRAGDHPVPGETMLYEINYGNDNEVASGRVWLTDTLPAYTSVYTWWSQNGYDLWQEESRNDELVLSAPTIPGHWGDTLYLRVEVDEGAGYDYELANRVDIYTAGDGDPDNNRSERSDWTGEPHPNVGVDKQFDWGQTVPGGEVRYWLGVQNYGNVAATVVMTETLPQGTTHDYTVRYKHHLELPFPPDYVDDEVAVWDLGIMEPGDRYELGVHLGYAGALVPGAILENCATVTMDGVHDDGWPFDDEACDQVQVRSAGPNFRVNKRVQWNWEGQIQYQIWFNNLGTTELQDVVITDILPEGTSFSGNWWDYFWEEIQFNQVGDTLNWTLSRLEPGAGSAILFDVNLDSGLIDVQGLAFTNTVQAPLTGDVFPGDNLHQVVVYTGPDLYAEKWHSGGELLPGEEITLTVRCGNQSLWPWHVHDEASVRLRERMPPGMSYVRATWPDGNDNPPDLHDPGTGLLMWDFGSLGSNDDRIFHLVVDLDAGLPLGEVLVNEVEVDQVPQEPDIDPVPGNNVFQLRLRLGKPVYLPLVSKNQ
jgi:uncharacterized repeat protein (TIGR01451 family)